MLFFTLLLFLLPNIIQILKSDNFKEVNNIIIDNWTSCEEFLNNTVFNPQSVVDIDWKIFYFWHYDFEESYHIKFGIPTPGLIKRFSVELDEELNPPVNWTDADLFMETSIDFSGLFIKTNISGLYRLISSISFQYSNTPYLTFGLKVVEPGYLGLMNCKHRLGYALAPMEFMPSSIELERAASKIGFWSPFGRSYLITDNTTTSPISLIESLDDADDDAQIDVDRQINNLQII
ncbi:uncharacterized protein LOC128200924 [Galleria mellonella]|uniref:Uncharacterized protein LOC128200924 n=1 Tax=Galleria mellonella TaxID=7137 RepID=A0ABM3MKE5_GALME|nr:uncharacterized protein LOC128200924 [Galleria mellonella]